MLFSGSRGFFVPHVLSFSQETMHTRHLCDAALCKQCKTAGCRRSDEGDVIQCKLCHRGFYGQDCFDRHRRLGMSPLLRGARNTVCKSFVACVLCNCDLKAVDGVST